MTLPADTVPENPVSVEQLLVADKPIKTRKPRETKHDFKDGQGRVPACRHVNGKGWVAKTAVVEDSVYVGPRAKVFQRAYISGNVRLEGQARVYGAACVQGNVLLKQSAQVCGEVVVRDNVEMHGAARIFGRAHVSGRTRLFDNVMICDSAQLISVTLNGRASVGGFALVVRSSASGDVLLHDNCVIINSTLYGNIQVRNSAQVLAGSNIRNSNSQSSVAILDYAIIADRTEIWSPVVFKQHAVAVRCRFAFGLPPNNQRIEIGENLVLNRQTPRTHAELENLIAALSNPAAQQLNRQFAQNNQAGGLVNHLASANRPRRVQRLQEAGV